MPQEQNTSGVHMSDSTEISALKVEVASLSQHVIRLADSTDRLVGQFERVGILETNHSHQTQAVERAFGEIKELQRAFEENDKEHKTYNKWVWLTNGFVLAVVAFWAVIGYHIEKMVDKQMEALADMRIHLNEDKIKTPEDVRNIHKDLMKEVH